MLHYLRAREISLTSVADSSKIVAYSQSSELGQQQAELCCHFGPHIAPKFPPCFHHFVVLASISESEQMALPELQGL